MASTLGGANLALMAAIGRLINKVGLPFMLAGDFNMGPETLERSGWAQRWEALAWTQGYLSPVDEGQEKPTGCWTTSWSQAGWCLYFRPQELHQRGLGDHIWVWHVAWKADPGAWRFLRPCTPNEIPKEGRYAKCLVEEEISG